VPSGTFEVADKREYVPKEQLDAMFNILSVTSKEGGNRRDGGAVGGVAGGLLCICTLAAEDCDPEGRGKGYNTDGKCARDIGFGFMGEVKITLGGGEDYAVY
jgi:hypothetical protein